MIDFTPHKHVRLKGHPTLTERWVQQLLSEDPTLLGLGEVEVKDTERMQPRAGRLDMLMFDAETNTRYEVELQLGATDESHIVRTVEYWDIERRRYPQYDHVGVIVAEAITSRFFNVVSLFNGFIPLTAIQMRAIEVNGATTLIFTTVLEPITLALEEEDEGEEPKDRSYWERKAAKATLKLTDDLFELVQEIAPNVTLNYKKNYIGLAKDRIATNFVTFRPKKQHALVEFKIPRSDDFTQRLQDAGMDLLTYQVRWGRYRLRIDCSDLKERRDLLRELVKTAHDSYGL